MPGAADLAGPHEPFVAGLVLATAGAARLGRPRRPRAFGAGTLLEHTLAAARTCHFGQLVVALGGAAQGVREQVDLSGADVVADDAAGSSSIAAAVDVLDPRAGLLVLLLGDQPGVTCETVSALLAGRGDAAVAVCRYDDGLGHPFAFARERFSMLRELPGDKAVWKVVAAGGDAVAKVPVTGPVPIDVDAWAHQEAVR
jgi:molybdenum cofactor cytidylyltransferase